MSMLSVGGDTVEKVSRERKKLRAFPGDKCCVKCRVVNEASLKQTVPWIVTKIQVTMLKPW